MAEHIKNPTVWFWIAGGIATAILFERVANTDSDWSTISPWAVILFVVALCIALWRRSVNSAKAKANASAAAIEEHQRRLAEHRGRFRLIKPVADLRPADFGFQFLDPGAASDSRLRPFYQQYLSRRIVPFDTDSSRDHGPVYTESDLAHALASGTHLAIVGQPTMGKSRTLYDVLKKLDGWLVVAPDPKQPTPPPDAFAELIAGQNVVVVLDDLNDFADATVDLQMFCDASRMGRANQWTVAATCRDGSELSVVREAVDSSLRRFYDDIPLKLALVPQTDDEKAELAAISGQTDWNPEDVDAFPTPGTIVMARALHYQRARFEGRDLSSLQKDGLRALKLLTAAGVLPLTHQRLKAVVTEVFGHESADLGDTLDALAHYAFLRTPARQDPIAPEMAYLREQVTPYGGSAGPLADFGRLQSTLESSQDADGLFLLGVTWSSVFGDHASALAVFDSVLTLQPNDPLAMHNRGTVLSALGRHAEALETYNTALVVRPDHSHTLRNKGVVLAKLGRHEEALKNFDAALARWPEHIDTLHNKGVVLTKLGRHEEALRAYDASVALRPGDAGLLHNKGATLVQLGRFEEALEMFDAALAWRPNEPGTLQNKGTALTCLGRHEDALEAFEAALEVWPEDIDLLQSKGTALGLLGKHEEAQRAFDEVLTLRPVDHAALYNKGVALEALGRHAEASEAFEAARALEALADNDTVTD